MIGDKIDIQPHHYSPGKEILPNLLLEIDSRNNSLCIGIGGESGCGKSTQAIAFKNLLTIEGFPTTVLHMDDYFRMPPKSNHRERQKDINHVGTKEVDMDLLNENIKFIKNHKSDILVKPLVNYQMNVIRKDFLQIHDVKVVIVEGTYSLLLDQVDIRIFMSRNYIETKPQRLARGRDQMSDFNESVLMIEHEIIRKHRRIANYIIDSNYNISKNVPTEEIGSDFWV